MKDTNMMRRIFSGLVVLIFLLSSCSTKTSSTYIVLEVKPTNYISKEVPVHVNVQLPSRFRRLPADEITVTLQSEDSEYKQISGQIIKSENGTHQLWWILPKTNRNNTVQWTATLTKDSDCAGPTFNWENTPGKHLDLFLDKKRVFRYSYELDDHFEKGEILTARNKAFYHIYDLQGEDVITNGPEKGLWSHHRGIMIGWRDVGFQGQKLSFWGMEDLTVQKHINFQKTIAGPVVAKVEALIHWNDSTGTTVIEEKRQATIYRQFPPVILLLDFASTLKAMNGSVTLDGNAEHGGVQYRAHNDVVEKVPGTKKPTYYFHQDGIDPHEDYNLPWVGMAYGLRNKMYSVLDMDHPDNPNPTIWSAYRDYARFGPFFREELDANETLNIHYRFWISEDSMPDRDILSSKYAVYLNPPQIRVITP